MGHGWCCIFIVPVVQALGTLVSAAAARAIVSLCVDGGTLVNGAVGRAGGGVNGGRKRKMLVVVLGASEEQHTLASGAARERRSVGSRSSSRRCAGADPWSRWRAMVGFV